MAERIFYSWQSDLPNATNRGMIQGALEQVAKALRADESVQVEPVIDRDTADVPGSPDIAATIFEKIRVASVFVADVSIINGRPRKGKRLTPNPNVLVELGFAVGVLGWDRVVLVANTAFGRVEHLPFDLRHRRVISYRSAASDGGRAEARKALEGLLDSRVREIFSHSPDPQEPQPGLSAAAVAALGAGAPNADSLVRGFAKSFCEQVGARRPAGAGEGSPFDRLQAALASTEELVAEYGQVCRSVAEHRAKEAALLLARGLGPILSACEFQPRKPDANYDLSYDFHRFIGHECFVMLVAALLREERLAQLADLFNETVYSEGQNGSENARFTDFAQTVRVLHAESGSRRRVSLHADMLKERHERAPLSAVCDFDEFVDADYFAFLRAELPPASSPYDALGAAIWRPWSSIYAERRMPAFVTRAQTRGYAEKLLPALALPNVETFAARFRERGMNIRKLWRQPFADFAGYGRVLIGSE